jgi:D-glycero-D-manno-heptose 1,7-bisphosphate phosphatase
MRGREDTDLPRSNTPVKIPRQCAILVGGLGTRLGSLTADTPKPLLDCGGRPFLAWVLRELARFGIADVVLLAGHKFDRVEGFCRELSIWVPRSLSVTVSVEPSPAGTGGALWHARHLLRDPFLLINGDSWFDTNLARFFAAAAASDAMGSVLLREMEDCARYGTAEIEGDRIVAFREKTGDAGPGLISGGIYVFNQRLLSLLSPECSLEKDILPVLVSQRQLTASVLEGFFIDIGIPSDYVRAGQDLPRRLQRAAVCFDREVLIGNNGWIPGAKEAVRMVNDAGMHAFLIRGDGVCAPDAALLPENMLESLLAFGATLDDVRLSDSTAPPEETQREPPAGEISDVLKRWTVDPRRAIVIGGQDAVRAGHAAGVESHLVAAGSAPGLIEPLINRLREAP